MISSQAEEICMSWGVEKELKRSINQLVSLMVLRLTRAQVFVSVGFPAWLPTATPTNV